MPQFWTSRKRDIATEGLTLLPECLDDFMGEGNPVRVIDEVCQRAYETVGEARASIGRYLAFWNGRSPHSDKRASSDQFVLSVEDEAVIIARSYPKLPSWMLVCARKQNLANYKFDISVILNVHDEAKFLRRTTRSIEESARYARSLGITVELVIVLDNGTFETRDWVNAYTSDAFNDVIKINVSNGSLGPSRNAGVAIARGEFVRLCDADDLISFNALSQSFLTAVGAHEKAIYCPEYLFAFGDKYYLYRMFSTGTLLRLSFVSGHPFVSSIFCRSDYIRISGFLDARLSAGIAYEDWHFNMEALANDFQFKVVKDTANFYRQRSGSVSRIADAISTRVTAASTFFNPKHYLRICGSDYATYCSGPKRSSIEEVRTSFLENQILREVSLAANRIDPAVDFAGTPHFHAFSNLDIDLKTGAAYYQACEIIGDARFDDVVLLPFLLAGGGEKYILSVINALTELNPKRRVLVITGEPCARHYWLERLPAGSVFLDLYQLGRDLTEEQRQVLTLRLIQATSHGALVHVKSCSYGYDFIRRFGALLTEMRLIFYRFSDHVEKASGEWCVRGFGFDFLSECGELFDVIVTDNAALAQRDAALLDTLSEKYRTIRLPASLAVKSAPSKRRLTKRLLWASRLAPEKRLELLPRIAEALTESLPDVSIHAYGTPALGEFNTALFEGRSNLSFHGPFSGFESLPFAEYDAFIYTSSFDGMPNVVLEAMAAGLTPIVPDIGGLREAVTPQTGYLVPNSPDNAELVASYVQAVRRFYDTGTDRVTLRISARKLVESRFSHEAFVASVANMLGANSSGTANKRLVPG